MESKNNSSNNRSRDFLAYWILIVSGVLIAVPAGIAIWADSGNAITIVL